MPHGKASSDEPPRTEHIERYCSIEGLTLLPAPMELVRLATPRRVYTQSHMDYVLEAFLQVHQRRQMIPSMKIVYEAVFLRHFTARFEPDG